MPLVLLALLLALPWPPCTSFIRKALILFAFKESQEDQGTLKKPGGLPSLSLVLAFLLALPWPPWNSIKLEALP